MKKFLISAVSIGVMTSAACAGPTAMTDEQLDSVVAGPVASLFWNSPAGQGRGAVFQCDVSFVCFPQNGHGQPVGPAGGVPGPNGKSAFEPYYPD